MISILLLLAFVKGTLFEGKPVEKAWSLLEAGLKDKSSDRRATATHSLGLIGHNRRARELAEQALSDSSADVRVQAAAALGEMHANQARQKLIASFHDKELKVALAAANALYEMHDHAADQVYIALLTGKRKTSEGLIQSQLDMLHNRKDVEKMALETGIGFVPYASMGWDAWKTITHDDTAGIVAAAALKLATAHDPESRDALKDAAGNKKWQVRAAVANAISKRGDRQLLDTAIDLMLDDNDAVRFAAAGAVLHLEPLPARRE